MSCTIKLEEITQNQPEQDITLNRTTGSPTNTPTSTTTPTFALSATETLTPTVTLTQTPSFTPSPTLGVGSFKFSEIDGMKQFYIPAGTFEMGATEKQFQYNLNHCVEIVGSIENCHLWEDAFFPQHPVYLDSYYVDEHSVTNEQYRSCVSDGECSEPIKSEGTIIYSYDNPEYGNHPVINVSWNQADTYCKWAGRRLGTEAEWEKAAKGPEGYFWPWGNAFDSSLGNFNDTYNVYFYLIPRYVEGPNDLPGFDIFSREIVSMSKEDSLGVDGYDYTSPVNSFHPNGYFLTDMAGNVFNYVRDSYLSPDYYQELFDESEGTGEPARNPQGQEGGFFKIYKGSSFESSDINTVSNMWKYWLGPDEIKWPIGIRCFDSEYKIAAEQPEQDLFTLPTPIHPSGEVVFHQSDETIAYNWFTYIPTGLSKKRLNYILITGLHGNVMSGDYHEITEHTRDKMDQRAGSGDIYDEFILLVPAIPRNQTNYPVSFDLYSFESKTDPFYQRPDLEINQMIDELLIVLRADGYNMADQVFIEGFSAGGMFAQRYTLLHPERVRAAVIGSPGGTIVLPESTYNDMPMNWPVGINNFEELVGYDFNQIAFREVPQFIYIGDQDTQNSTVWSTSWGTQSMWESVDQLRFLNQNFGSLDPARIVNQVNFLNNLGYDNIIIKLYPDIEHKITEQMEEDYWDFLRMNRE